MKISYISMQLQRTVNKQIAFITLHSTSFVSYLSGILLYLLFAKPVAAQGPGPQAWSGVCVYNQAGTGHTVATIQGLQCLIANVLGVAVTIVGLIAFGVFIFSSVQIMLSGGNSKGLETARGSMTYAVVGIVVALSAFIILGLISSFTGVDFTRFIIPDPTSSP